MTQIMLTEEQARLFYQSGTRVQFCDPKGTVLADIARPEVTPEEIAEYKRRAASPGPRYTGAQVRARLDALQAEWDRTGGFDEAYMREFLERLREADPGHMRNKA